MSHSVYPDQTAPWEQSDLGLHYLSVLVFLIFRAVTEIRNRRDNVTRR